ncbi:MAG: PDZ domain-containing protein [Phycisphaerales bacterium]|nr:PDZ domain-containing protein [Phycisphaerales bacterium]
MPRACSTTRRAQCATARRATACWAIACWAAGAGGQPTISPDALPDTRPPRGELIARLGSPVFAAREQAAYDLLTLEDLTVDEAELELARPGLSAEQRLRLEWVALERFRRGPRAALGIQFMSEREGSVRVQEVVPGFHAAAVLMPGDEIVEADGVKVQRQATFRAAILSHAPKDIMRLTVVRGDQRLLVEVELGSFESLAGGVGPRESDILAAWNLRRVRNGPLGHAEPLTPSPLPTDTQKPATGEPAWQLLYATADAPPGLRVGGQARETLDLSLTQLAAIDASRSLTLDDLQDAGDADLAVQVALLRDRRGLMLDDIDRMTQLIEGRNLDAAGRAMMRRRLEEQRQILQILEEQIRVLEEARRARP